MSEAFVAEIRIFPFNFAPTGWAMCNGQLLPISQNTALFSLVGTFYGGDGKSTFALPDLQGSVAVHSGQGAGLSERFLGEQAGSETVTLLQSEIPAHNHQLKAFDDTGGSPSPAANSFAFDGVGSTTIYSPNDTNPVTMHPSTVLPTGSSLPHNNMQPYLVLNYCIAMQGIFPSRQ
jgi:microcystin-dependent protein